MPKKTRAKPEKYLTDSLLILAGLTFVAVYYYGARALMIIGIAVLTSVAAGAFVSKLSKKALFSGVSPDLVLGFVTGLMFPVSASYLIVFIAALFGSLICRAVFGGYKNEPVSPSAVSLLFVYYTFGAGIFLCPPIFGKLPLSAEVYPETLGQTYFADILQNGVTDASGIDLLFGRLPFYLGGGAALILIIAFIFFVLRRDISFVSAICTLAVFAALALLTGAFDVKGTLFMVSALLFPLIFCIMPFTGRFLTLHAKIFFGVAAGLVISAFVLLSKTPAAGFFAAVLLAPLSIYLEGNDFSFVQFLPKKLRYVKLEKL
jgi:Na+-translocating ferredoxin:NAD+ oxidoreductase RnfD subunit